MTDRLNKTSICSIVFLDIVDHSKKSVHDQIEDKTFFNSLINEAIKNVAQNDRIIIDTGDGAAIAFMGEPEDALFTALIIRDGILEHNLSADQHILVRIGINLGSVRVVKDINGRPNIIGDGINVAERIMSFAGENQILVSRSYYEVTARLTKEITGMFLYSGLKQDKHVREHEVYSIIPKAISSEDGAALAYATKEALNYKKSSVDSKKSNQKPTDKKYSIFANAINAIVKSVKQVSGQYFTQIQHVYSNATHLKDIRTILLIVSILTILLLSIWLIWREASDEETVTEVEVLDTLTHNEAIEPINQMNVELTQETLIVEPSISTNAEKISSDTNTKIQKKSIEMNQRPESITTPKPKAGPIKATVSKDQRIVAKPKSIDLLPSTQLEAKELESPQVVNKITCSQAQIAMNQCRN